LQRTRFCYANFICAHLRRGGSDDNWSETFLTRPRRGRFRKVGKSLNDWPAGLKAFGRDGCGADDLAGRRRPREIRPDPRRFVLRQPCPPALALLTGQLSLPRPFPNTQGRHSTSDRKCLIQNSEQGRPLSPADEDFSRRLTCASLSRRSRIMRMREPKLLPAKSAAMGLSRNKNATCLLCNHLICCKFIPASWRIAKHPTLVIAAY
jgi:hypothetical protein